ncbi:tRNA lysidine(34) synthetase TilS [Snuella sedimenti]|uniref:tRNA(Ile)-lysidine synthase n=1 Tax=Snuella sedimenti TaxID=2798802 RepID=A0A8J7LRJ1_9FLAO|nr:tRNA lysidine(34) synthetase TilS [Snuella sedimenti]MBJ6367230.1 tRNA lysidine(34) synthetase TilS [Snuella sedimenti]
MIEQAKHHINTKLPFLRNKKLLVAISGGLDSVVLTHICYTLGLDIKLAHCNFNLRGDESDTDEDFVLQLAEDLDLEVFVESFDTEAYAKANKQSIQIAARELRYNWFDELASQLQFDYILTAHHADDNLETFLINLSRGTGLDGLTGIPEINGRVIRPLLPFSREAILKYAKEHRLQWREDSSNVSTKYLRNKLRHDVIPILKDINPKLLQNFSKTQGYLNASRSIIEDRIIDVLEAVVEHTGDQTTSFNIEALKKLRNPKAYLFELLKPYNFTEWDDVVALMDAQSGKQVLSHTHRLIKDREYLLLSELPSKTSQSISVASTDTVVDIPLGALHFKEVAAVKQPSKAVVYVDKATLQFPLVLRQWHEGDVFYPLGMTGKKKLSKYFKDEKLSLLDKEQVWLLCSGDAIVWIVNWRPDNRFKVTNNTQTILEIALQ